MEILDKKWVRALFSIGISVVTIVIFLCLLFTESLPSGVDIAAFVGVLSIVGIILIYVATDILDQDIIIVKIIRYILIGLGVLVILGCGGTSLLLYSMFSDSFGDVIPWVCAVGGLWSINGIATAICFYFAADADAREWMPFIQLLTLLGSYIIFVIFAYLGRYVHFFFYGWIFLIACVASIVFSIIGLVKSGGIDLPIADESKEKNPKLEITIYDDDKNRDVKTKEYDKLSTNREYRIALKIINTKDTSLNYDDIEVHFGKNKDKISIPHNESNFEMEKSEYNPGFIIKSKSLDTAKLTFEYVGGDKREIDSASCTLRFLKPKRA